ncbi:hypothetical protein Mmc1_2101 [Magnetococcus marinus MC-1]|uniref:Uncharacterized protein n=1 Tax=Magnetococcus marinus (strain ATCC BAA-1437 / JCM 17883 / MC-1) TaxID=156889 RepID=A0L9F9_MAGMM|nr:hypothetical protein [Magnetococcus marinus]ABK44602.1 hypothetical protein Mmc1_2101 [Magnetococcus marinus MC-1]
MPCNGAGTCCIVQSFQRIINPEVLKGKARAPIFIAKEGYTPCPNLEIEEHDHYISRRCLAENHPNFHETDCYHLMSVLATTREDGRCSMSLHNHFSAKKEVLQMLEMMNNKPNAPLIIIKSVP